MLWQRTLAVGPLACNCTILTDAKRKVAGILDPGDDAPGHGPTTTVGHERRRLGAL